MRKNLRVFYVLMAATLIFVQKPVSAAAEEKQSTHECAAITMRAEDVQTHTVGCSECGVSVLEEHSFGAWNAQDEECHVCVCDCGASVTEPHDWDSGVVDEESGFRTYTCTVCRATFTKEEDVLEDLEVASSGEEVVSSTDEKTLRDQEVSLEGDADGDGQITGNDLSIINAIAFGLLPSPTVLQINAADINHDGCVNARDVVFIYKVLASQNEKDVL